MLRMSDAFWITRIAKLMYFNFLFTTRDKHENILVNKKQVLH